MKMILRVAKTELRTLFYSPIAWFLLIIFLVQCGITYLGNMEGWARMQDMRGAIKASNLPLTEYTFLGRNGLFPSVMQNLYLYIPLLTMGLISRETSSGTIRLLYSSPIKVREIVFGKYLAMMIYSLLLVGIVGIFVISGIFQIPHLEKGMLFVGLLGFYLLLCAYTAIGLFMSCLTTYQIVAAICTFVMIGALSYVGELWQRVAFVRELTYFLSIRGRAENMLRGLLTTRDVIYFVVIVFIFLGLSIYRLRAGMESKPAMVKAARYIAVVASAFLIGYISSIPGFIGYFDATANKTRTLTPKVQKILAEFGDEPIEVTAYNNLLDKNYWLGDPGMYKLNQGRWEPYTRFKSNIKLNTIDYYDSSAGTSYIWRAYPGKNLLQMAEQYARNLDVSLKGFLTPTEMRKIKDLRREGNRYVMQLKWKDKTSWLRVFEDQMVWPGETEVAAALKRLQQAKLPRIAFLTGDLERDISKRGDRDYKMLTTMSTFRYSLVNQGFDVDTVSLETQDIPSNIATLVIADPKIPLQPATMAKLRQYIANGGNLMIAGEPGRQSILNPLLQPLGVQMMDGMIVQQSTDDAPDQATLDLTQWAGTFSKPLKRRVEDSTQVFMPGVSGLKITNDSGYTIRPLLMSDAKLAWNRMKPIDLEIVTSAVATDEEGSLSKIATPRSESPVRTAPGKNRAAAGAISFSAADGDTKGSFPTAVSLTRSINGREQRIVVSGDADFLATTGLRPLGVANFSFSTGIFSWLSYGEFPIDASRPDPKDTGVTIKQDDMGALRLFYFWIGPGLLLLFAAILLIRRKRK